MNLYNESIQSVIVNDRCDLQSAFRKIIWYYDPNKCQNFKTNVLDCSYSLTWNEKDIKLFKIDSKRNLNGVNKNYDLIVYEPPKNKNFYIDITNSTKLFKKLLSKNGALIIKTNDFRTKGTKELKGCFEVWDIVSNEGFYLTDNIIYTFDRSSFQNSNSKSINIVHLYFLIFKKSDMVDSTVKK